ncbi:MAG: hypothetical protein IIY47_04325 [Solobacterium sp.]|nr:hypothetical protein [Solobacterium sp.]
MNELTYILSRFEEHFHSLKGRNIALYPGRYRDDIIRHFGHAYKFLCIPGPAGMEAAEGAEAVILTDPRQAGEPDFAQVHAFCEAGGTALLDLFGLDLIAVHRELAGYGYLPISGWKALLEDYDVISMIAPKIAVKYLKMEKRWVLRRRFRIMYDWMKSRGKDIVLFCEEDEQVRTLAEEGIDTRDCVRVQAGRGQAYLETAERYAGKRIIHIGVDVVKDGILPREYGMDSRLSRGFVFDGRLVSPAKDLSWHADRKALIDAIDSHDIISFDIFDTLVKRLVLHPKDVFLMVEEQTGLTGYADCRYEIQTTIPQSSLKEIYGYLGERMGYDAQTLAMLCEAELQTEMKVIVPRQGMQEIFMYAKQRGKTVILVSDMYLDAAFMETLLAKNGITGYDAMYLSYQYRKLKHEGLYEELSGWMKDGRTILHIGDNHYADVVSARRYGIDPWLIPSSLDMAKKNGYAEVIAASRTLAERKLLGLGIALGFDSPFANDHDAEIADMILTPLIMGYLQWVCGEMADRGYDFCLLCSRDGWILQQAYEKLRRQKPGSLPPARYIYTSRHAAYLTIMDDFNMAKYFFDLDKFRDDPPKMLRQILCLPAEEILPYHGESTEEYWHMHADVISRTAQQFRRNYRKYLENEGAADRKCAVMDFVSEGGSQMMLEKHVTGKLDGYYIGIPEYVYKYAGNIRYYLDHDLMDYNTELKLEVYFTSMEPAVDHIGEDGRPVFTAETRSEKMRGRIEAMHSRIQEALDMYLECLYSPRDIIGKELIFQLCSVINNYRPDNEYYDDMSGTMIGSGQEH